MLSTLEVRINFDRTGFALSRAIYDEAVRVMVNYGKCIISVSFLDFDIELLVGGHDYEETSLYARLKSFIVHENLQAVKDLAFEEILRNAKPREVYKHICELRKDCFQEGKRAAKKELKDWLEDD